MHCETSFRLIVRNTRLLQPPPSSRAFNILDFPNTGSRVCCRTLYAPVIVHRIMLIMNVPSIPRSTMLSIFLNIILSFSIARNRFVSGFWLVCMFIFLNAVHARVLGRDFPIFCLQWNTHMNAFRISFIVNPSRKRSPAINNILSTFLRFRWDSLRQLWSVKKSPTSKDW